MQTKVSRMFKTSLIYGAVMSVMTSTPILAEENTEEEQDANVITVTARKKAETLMEVPMNISAISAMDISDRNLLTKEDIYRSIAGAANPRGELILRGLSGGNSAFPGTSSSFTDGIPWDFSELFDVERVEVLRGPQGTLWGSNAIGGTVQVITNKPVIDEFEVFGAFQTTDEAHIDGVASAGFAGINLPINDTMALRVTGSSSYTPKKITNSFTGVQGHGESQFVRAQLLWDATDDMSVNFGYVREQSYDVGTDTADRSTTDSFYRAELTPNAAAPFGYDVGVVSVDCAVPGSERPACRNFGPTVESDPKYTIWERFDDWAEREFDLYSVSVDHEDIAGIASMSYVGSYREYYNGSLDNWSRLDASDMFTTWIINDFSGDRTTHELRFQNLDVDSAFDWTVGYFYDKIDDGDNPNGQWQYHGDGDEGKAIASYWWSSYLTGWTDDNQQAITDIAALGQHLYGDPNKNYNINQMESWSTEKALFSEVSYTMPMGDGELELTGGIRFYDLEDYSLIGETGIWVGPDGGITEQGGQEDGNRKKFSASWKPNSGNMSVYSVYSEGYRPGGNNMVSLPQSCRNDVNAGNFKSRYNSDEIENIELGFKGAFNDNTFRMSAAVYQIDWSGVQVSIYMPSCGFSFTDNAGEAESTGFEFESTTNITDDLVLTFNAGYTDSQLLTDIDSLGAKAGDDMTMVPEYNVYLALDQGFTWFDREAYVRFDMEGYGDYKSHFNIDARGDSADISEAYEVFNLSGRVQLNDNVNLSLHINNLFDKEFTTYKAARSRNSSSSAAQNVVYGDSRNITMRVNWTF